MLVLIVVAAAVAFSLFVASYQSQVQKEQQAAHNRALEGLHIVSVTPGPPLPNGTFNRVVVRFVSADVNPMNLTSLLLDDAQVLTWLVSFNGGNTTGCTVPLAPAQFVNCTIVPPLASVTLTLAPVGPTFSFSSDIRIEFVTQLSNAFRYTFVPPVAIATYRWIPSGNTSFLLFDGTNSLQPSGGDNATLVNYRWAGVGHVHFSIHYGSNNTTVVYDNSSYVNGSGPLFEPSQTSNNASWVGNHGILDLWFSYNMTLTLTNSDGLVNSVEIQFLGR
jgi:hypothetical protein